MTELPTLKELIRRSEMQLSRFLNDTSNLIDHAVCEIKHYLRGSIRPNVQLNDMRVKRSLYRNQFNRILVQRKLSIEAREAENERGMNKSLAMAENILNNH